MVQQNAPPAPSPLPDAPPIRDGSQPGPVPIGENAYFVPGSQSPARMLDAAKAYQRELQRQQERLESRREDLVDEINDSDTPDAALAGLQARLTEIDARISTLDAQLAEADAKVAQQSAVPGAVQSSSSSQSRPNNGPSDGMIAIPIVFTIFVLFPLAIGYARRMWKRGATIIAPVPKEVRDRLDQMGEAVESMALEVERIGEGQRFLTRVMSENPRELGAGGMQPIAVPRPAEAAPVRREAQENWR